MPENHFLINAVYFTIFDNRFRPGKNTRVGPGSRFSAAESEFIRLFEDHNGVFDSFRHDSGASSVDVMADSDPSNIKVEDFLSSLGFNNFNTSIFDSTTTPNGDSNGDEGENFNKQLLTKLGNDLKNWVKEI